MNKIEIYYPRDSPFFKSLEKLANENELTINQLSMFIINTVLDLGLYNLLSIYFIKVKQNETKKTKIN